MTPTSQTNTTLEEIAEVLRNHDTFAICGHVSPDGDCIGSQLALKNALESLGKSCVCLLAKDEPVDFGLTFLPGSETLTPAKAFKGNADVFIGVDVPSRERMGEDACSVLDECNLSITIDHHASDARMCDFAYIDPTSASCTMLIWDLAKILLAAPSYECALCCFTGLVTDTGGFRFQNADARSFAAGGEMVSYGADPSLVSTNVFMNRSLASLQLVKLTLERLDTCAEGSVVLSWISNEDMAALGAGKPDAEPLINTLRSIRGVRVACMLKEQEDCIRGSLRSKDDTNVAEIAKSFGGGGHIAAAGFTLNCSLEEAIALVKEALVSALSKKDNNETR